MSTLLSAGPSASDPLDAVPWGAETEFDEAEFDETGADETEAEFWRRQGTLPRRPARVYGGRGWSPAYPPRPSRAVAGRAWSPGYPPRPRRAAVASLRRPPPRALLPRRPWWAARAGWVGVPAGSARVGWLQDCLNRVLGLDLPVTGLWSPATRGALRAFQRQAGLWPSGVADPRTRAVLGRTCAAAVAPEPVAAVADQSWDGPEPADAPPPDPDDGGGPDTVEAELGPLNTRIKWLFRRDGTRLDYLWSIDQAAGASGGGVYILLGTERSPGAKPMLLKVGLAPSFKKRFGVKGYGVPSGHPKDATGQPYDNVRAYLGRVAEPPSPLPQIERAIARVLYRAGETLPLDNKAPGEGPVLGPVRIVNILPVPLGERLRAAYRARTGVEQRRARPTGAPRQITAGTRADIPRGAKPRELILEPGQFPRWELGGDSDSFSTQEVPMHDAHACSCPQCCATRHRAAVRSPFSEEEELTLAMELLSVASEEELDQFLGKLFKGAWRGLKKVGRFIGKVAKPIGRALKGVAKVALPFVGKALGSFIPIPGVGTMIGGAVGSAIGKALEAEYAGLDGEERELEMARAFVQMAGAAARDVAARAPDGATPQALEAAVLAALRRQVPRLTAVGAPPGYGAARPGSGRWVRRGGGLLVLDA